MRPEEEGAICSLIKYQIELALSSLIQRNKQQQLLAKTHEIIGRKNLKWTETRVTRNAVPQIPINTLTHKNNTPVAALFSRKHYNPEARTTMVQLFSSLQYIYREVC